MLPPCPQTIGSFPLKPPRIGTEVRTLLRGDIDDLILPLNIASSFQLQTFQYTARGVESDKLLLNEAVKQIREKMIQKGEKTRLIYYYVTAN